jgi:hypothetical protein
VLVVLIHIISHHLTDVVDPKGQCPKHGVVTRHVEYGEGAVAPDEAMTCCVCIPVGSHDLALRVDEAAYRSDRTERVDRGEIAIVLEKGVIPVAIKVRSRELARRVDSVEDSTTGQTARS